jgi:hypothetical protein
MIYCHVEEDWFVVEGFTYNSVKAIYWRIAKSLGVASKINFRPVVTKSGLFSARAEFL